LACCGGFWGLPVASAALCPNLFNGRVCIAYHSLCFSWAILLRPPRLNITCGSRAGPRLRSCVHLVCVSLSVSPRRTLRAESRRPTATISESILSGAHTRANDRSQAAIRFDAGRKSTGHKASTASLARARQRGSSPRVSPRPLAGGVDNVRCSRRRIIFRLGQAVEVGAWLGLVGGRRPTFPRPPFFLERARPKTRGKAARPATRPRRDQSTYLRIINDSVTGGQAHWSP